MYDKHSARKDGATDCFRDKKRELNKKGLLRGLYLGEFLFQLLVAVVLDVANILEVLDFD